VTCIVGVVDGDRVLIGGDSAGSDGWGISIRSDTKVFRTGTYVMGFTSSFRMGQLLRYSLEVSPPDSWDVDRFMATSFINAVRRCLKDGGWLKTDNGVERGGTFLVGVAGRLYVIHSDFQIGYTADGYAACGSGEMVALGSLHSTPDLDPETRVRAALEAASHHTSSVAGPYTVEATR
jgi:hypothetical protein